MNQRKLALFDIDKTIYNGYILFPLAEYFLERNIIRKETIDCLYQDLALYHSQEVDYETTIENFNLHFAHGLKNHSPKVILSATATLLRTREARNFYAFAQPLFRMLQETYDIYFVTGELQFVGKAVADYFPVKGYLSSEMEITNSVYTGNIKKSLTKREGKSNAIEALFKTYLPTNSMAFGDSEGDIEMLARVDHAFCINATEGLLRAASARHWNTVTPDSVIQKTSQVIRNSG